MDDILRKTCEDFIENRDLLRNIFKNEGMAMHLMGAALLSSSEERLKPESLLESEKILKKCEGFFSPFRGALKLPVIINMARKDEPEEYLRLVRQTYDMICLDKGRRDESYYLPAMAIAFEADSEEELPELVNDYELTSSDSRDLDELLAGTGMPDDDIKDDVDRADAYLKEQKGFGLMGVGSEMRRIYAKMLVCIAYGQKTGADSATESAFDDAMQSRYRAAQATQRHMMIDQQLLLQTQLMQLVQ